MLLVPIVYCLFFVPGQDMSLNSNAVGSASVVHLLSTLIVFMKNLLRNQLHCKTMRLATEGSVRHLVQLDKLQTSKKVAKKSQTSKGVREV